MFVTRTSKIVCACEENVARRKTCLIYHQHAVRRMFALGTHWPARSTSIILYVLEINMYNWTCSAAVCSTGRGKRVTQSVARPLDSAPFVRRLRWRRRRKPKTVGKKQTICTKRPSLVKAVTRGLLRSSTKKHLYNTSTWSTKTWKKNACSVWQ